jgi:hypothetical protein
MSKNTAKRIVVPAAPVAHKEKKERKERAPFKIRFMKNVTNFLKMTKKAQSYNDSMRECVNLLAAPLVTLTALIDSMPPDWAPVDKISRTPAMHLSVGMLVRIKDDILAPRTNTRMPIDQYDWIVGCKAQTLTFRVDAINVENNMAIVACVTDDSAAKGKSLTVKFGHVRQA